MANICVLVFNPAIRDARVIKQAESLSAKGHQVTIVGLADPNFPEERAVLDSGVIILRVTKDSLQQAKPFGRRFLFLLFQIFGFSYRLYRGYLDFLIVGALLVYIALFSPTSDEINNFIIDNSNIIILSLCLYYFLHGRFKLKRGILNLKKATTRNPFGKKSYNKIKLFQATTKNAIIDFLRNNFPELFHREMLVRSALRINAMVRIVEKLSPDIVHCHDIHTLPAGAKIKSMLGCPVIYDAHEIYEEIAQASPEISKIYRSKHKKYLPIVDGFVTINESISSWYTENYPDIPRPVIVMNATIRTPVAQYDGRLHEAADLPRSQKILLYQGGYSPKRGLEYLVKSAAYLPAGWSLVLMGWGRLEERLRDLAHKIDHEVAAPARAARICFVPPAPQSELALWSAGATIGVIPYENVGLNHWYCTPNKLWEYPNADVPILVSPFPELRKPVEKYGFGWLLSEDQDPAKLAAQVAALSDSDIERAKKACAVYSDKEHWAKYEVELLRLYDEILSVKITR